MQVYDIETYPNAFTCWIIDADTNERYYYEISDYRNDQAAFRNHCMWLTEVNKPMVGFNNMGFDYPVIHFILTTTIVTAQSIYQRAMEIINTPWDDRFQNIIWQPLVEQIDLFKIKHYDNAAKATRLKYLEFVMRMDSIQDLPYELGVPLLPHQVVELAKYNLHDVEATLMFMREHCQEDLELRRTLSQEYQTDMTNFNDTKIGTVIFEKALKDAGVSTEGKTFRDYINLGEVVLPYVGFVHPELNRILNYFRNTTIKQTKGAFDNLTARAYGVDFVFGTGGIHASIDGQTVTAEDGWEIVDVDVASYYPNLAIKNRWYPKHLSEIFCDIYEKLYVYRGQFGKKDPRNKAIKLALNGTYGNSNSKYSIFYDPQFTMSITVNGQLLLCMLAEHLAHIPTVQLIQANTDGVTVKVRSDYRPYVDQACRWWESVTKLTLESANYSTMWIRDVNNYVAAYVGGGYKRKGAYEYERQPHQNHSMLIVPKVAFARLTGEGSPSLRDYTDWYDFMGCAKVPRSSKLRHGDNIVQPITRYYVSTDGAALTKIMPPLKGGVKDREIGINKGWLTTVCNNVGDFNPATINYDFYEKEINKLTKEVGYR